MLERIFSGQKRARVGGVFPLWIDVVESSRRYSPVAPALTRTIGHSQDARPAIVSVMPFFAVKIRVTRFVEQAKHHNRRNVNLDLAPIRARGITLVNAGRRCTAPGLRGRQNKPERDKRAEPKNIRQSSPPICKALFTDLSRHTGGRTAAVTRAARHRSLANKPPTGHSARCCAR